VTGMRALACLGALLATPALAVEGSLFPDLVIESRESGDNVKGEVTAFVDHPFAGASAALRDPAQWCEVLILSLNVKYCRPSGAGDDTALRVVIGSTEDTMESAYPVDFTYRIAAFGTSRSFLDIVHSVSHGRGGLHGRSLPKFMVGFRCPKFLKIASIIRPKYSVSIATVSSGLNCSGRVVNPQHRQRAR